MKIVPIGSLFGVAHRSYSPALVAAAKATPGMSWDPANKAWVGARDAVALVIASLKSRGLRLENDLPPEAVSSGNLLALKGLRDYQRVAVDFLLTRKNAILADDMGLGKTCSALTAARALNSKTLVVCPNYVRSVWWNEVTGGEIKKWWPAAVEDVFLPTGTKVSFDDIPLNAKVIVIHYDILHAWAEALSIWGPRVVIFDEGHALMSEGSRRSKAARLVSANAEMRWVLTGTPLTNRPRDLWNVVDTIAPGSLGKFFAFGLRYCAAEKKQVTPTKAVWVFDGASNLEELNARLKHRMLRRVKAEVALELPPKTRQVVYLSDVKIPRRKPTAGDGEMGAAALRSMLDKTADAKIPAVTEAVLQHARDGHRVVAFCWRKSVAEWLVDSARAEKLPAELVHGGIPVVRRGMAIDRAKGATGGHILAATIDVASVGIDLTYADVAVFCELVYEPHKLLQAEARLHRFGQTAGVLIQYLIAPGTIDEVVASKVIGKLDIYETAIGNVGESLAKDLTGKEDEIMNELYAAMAKMGAA